MRESLKSRISGRTGVQIAVIGVGYVGLPLAVQLASKEFSVIGVDVRSDIVNKLRNARSTVEGIEDDDLRKVVNKSLKLISVDKNDPAQTSTRILKNLLGTDVFIVCVPTPLHQLKRWEPDTNYIEQARNLITKICQIEKRERQLPRERLIILESTTYPGTTKKLFSNILSAFKSPSRRWYLVYSPERTNPGPHAYRNDMSVITQAGEAPIPTAFYIPRVVGGIDKESRILGRIFYSTVYETVQEVSSLEAAEMTKLVENTFRFISIAFANELSRIAKTFGLNVWEIIEAARGKKFGFELCYPGLIGGHCLPIDPHYLNWAARNRRLAANLVDVAEEEHQKMRYEAFDLIHRLLNQQNRGISGSSILFMGVSYKKDIGDIRESAALKLMERLVAAGARITFWDPVRSRHPAKPRVHLEFTEEQYRSLSRTVTSRTKWDASKARYYIQPKEVSGEWEAIKKRVIKTNYDCVVIATDHSDFRPSYNDLILEPQSPPVADLCNAVQRWLDDEITVLQKRSALRKAIGKTNKYMLLGRH